MASRMPWLISGETCHQNVVQNGLPSTSDELEADRVERDLVDLEDGALGVEQPDELHHRVEGDPRDLLAVALAGIGGDDFRAAHRDWAAGVIDRHAMVGILRCDTAIVNRASFP